MFDFLLSLDHSLFLLVNEFARRSSMVDMLMQVISNNEMPKGLFVMMLFWGLWFSHDRFGRGAREKLLGTLMMTVAAIAIGRALAMLLPFRNRPIYTPGLDFNLPFETPPGSFEAWSSMPSDHAVMFFGLAAGLCLVSRAVGAIALVHAVLVISLPRVYLGLHFPSDIAVGALVGGALGVVLVPPLARVLLHYCAMDRIAAYPYLFYPAMFFVTFQAASMFDPLREFGREFARAVPWF